MPPEPAARRIKVAKRPGIYYRELPTGKRRYEVTFLDTDGRRRWKTIDGDLDAAQAALDDARTKTRRGEATAPTDLRLAAFGRAWLETVKPSIREKTYANYESNFRLHIEPRLGRLRVGDVTVDHVASVLAEMKHDGYKPWTIRGVLTVMSRMLGAAARRGLIGGNPCQKLERGERPKPERRQVPELTPEQVALLVHKTPERYRLAVALAVFTGIRQSELLALRWADVDAATGTLRVRFQLSRQGAIVEPKTPTAKRDVVVMPTLGRMLRERREAAFACGLAKSNDFVVASEVGTPLGFRNLVRRGLEPALAASGLPKLRWHDLRHLAASLLIAEGADVVFISRQLGHSSPAVTLSIYSHVFDRVRHADRTRDALEATFGSLLG